MVWRALARRGGNFRNVNFNVFGNSAELVSKLEFHADIAVFVNLDAKQRILLRYSPDMEKVFVVEPSGELTPIRLLNKQENALVKRERVRLSDGGDQA